MSHTKPPMKNISFQLTAYHVRMLEKLAGNKGKDKSSYIRQSLEDSLEVEKFSMREENWVTVNVRLPSATLLNTLNKVSEKKKIPRAKLIRSLIIAAIERDLESIEAWISRKGRGSGGTIFEKGLSITSDFILKTHRGVLIGILIGFLSFWVLQEFFQTQELRPSYAMRQVESANKKSENELTKKIQQARSLGQTDQLFKLLVERGSLHLKAKNPHGGLIDFLEAEKIRPKDFVLISLLAQAYRLVGEDELADAYLKKLESQL